MRRSILYAFGIALLAFSSSASATTFRFDTDPFAGTNVRNTPGRQIVAGEPFINFTISSDVFSLESTAFGVGSSVNFANGVVANLPTGGVNVVVLDSFDDDNNPQTPFGAGQAANLIAGHVTTPGAGFFVYFNQALDVSRLVFSTDLSSVDADLKIVARMVNLNGEAGRDAMPTFTASNFNITTAPEPASFLMVIPAICAGLYITRRKKAAIVTKTQMSAKLKTSRSVVVGLALASLTSGAALAESGKHNEIDFTAVADSTEGFSAFGDFPAINNRGEVAFRALHNGVEGVFTRREGTHELTNIATGSDSLSAFGDDVAINASGVVAFDATTNTGSRAILKGDGKTRTVIGDSTVNGFVKIFMGQPSINAAGTVAFFSFLTQKGSPSSVFTGNGGPLKTIAMTSATGFTGFQDAAINDAGTVVFSASRADGSLGVFTVSNVLTDIIDTNAHPEIDNFTDPVINNAGTVACIAFEFPSDAPLVFTATSKGITPRNDPTNPPFADSEHPSINNRGAVAFSPIPRVATNVPTGLFLEVSGGKSLIPVLRPGDKLFGSTVDHVKLGRFALNDRFQMAFSYALTDGRTGIAVASFNGEGEGDDGRY